MFFSSLSPAFYSGRGAQTAVLPHTHGFNEAQTMPSSYAEEILVWLSVPAGTALLPAAAQTHQEEGKGKCSLHGGAAERIGGVQIFDVFGIGLNTCW